MRSRTLAAAALSVLVIGVSLVVAGCSAHPTAAYSKLAHLDQGTVVSTGVVPPIVPGAAKTMVTASLRMLTVSNGIEFWVGATSDNTVCFIARSAQTQSTCVDADRFGRYGATLQLPSSTQRYWLHLEYMTVAPSWTVISPNIALRP